MTEKANKKRNDIVISVFGHVPEVDFTHITIKELCAVSGISVGAFYHYFGDKAGFFAQVFAIVDEYIVETVSENIGNSTFEQKLLRFCAGFASCANEMGARMFKSVYASCPFFSDEDEKKRPLFKIPYEILYEAQAQKKLYEGAEIEKLTGTLLVLLRGYVYDWSHRDGQYDIAEKISEAAGLFIRGIQK